MANPSQPLVLAISPNQFNQWKLPLATNPFDELTWIILHASSTAWAIFVFVKIRRDQVNKSITDNTASLTQPFVYQIFRSTSLFSWLFDLALFILAGATLLAPNWSIFVEGFVRDTEIAYDGYLFVLVLLLARLTVSNWYEDRTNQKNFVHIGAIIFTCYLIPRLTFNSVLGSVYLIICILIYYLLLTHNRKWLSAHDWLRLKTLFSPEREELVRQIISLDQIQNLESAVDAQSLSLAQGKVKPNDYQETRNILDKIVAEKRENLAKLYKKLGIPDFENPKNTMFRLGPAETPFKKSLVAIGFGLIPYLIFIILASWSENLLGTVSISGVQYTVFRTIAVPWGPIYLFFFGYFFHILWGNYGVIKGLVFSLVLASLNILFDWLWVWDQVDWIEIWSTTLRILVVFVFTGVMMDWMTIRFSWRRIRSSYDSPAFTTIIAVFGTAVTSVITALATGTTQQLLAIVVQGTSIAFGGHPNLGP